jgi:hypothetical protein
MAGSAPTTAIRGRLSTFARGVARPFTDSRRRRFVADMIRGLVVGGHVHLTAVARAPHATEKRLSGHLASPCWNSAPLHAELLRRSAALVTADTLMVADTTERSVHGLRGG